MLQKTPVLILLSVVLSAPVQGQDGIPGPDESTAHRDLHIRFTRIRGDSLTMRELYGDMGDFMLNYPGSLFRGAVLEQRFALLVGLGASCPELKLEALQLVDEVDMINIRFDVAEGLRRRNCDPAYALELLRLHEPYVDKMRTERAVAHYRLTAELLFALDRPEAGWDALVQGFDILKADPAPAVCAKVGRALLDVIARRNDAGGEPRLRNARQDWLCPLPN